jgi:multidrug efflux pump subunit AcrA (membrane-fusion protein)
MLSLWRRTRPWVRVVSVSAVVVLLAVAGTGVYWFGFRNDSATAADAGSTTTTVTASTTTFEQSVSATGTLTPAVQEDVSFAVSGTVTSVDVAAGDTVTAGQQLATVDTLQLNADLLSAKSDLVSAQAELTDAEDDADGSDSSDAQIASLTAQVEVKQAAYDAAEEDMAAATLTAPVAGLLTEVNVAVGDAVTGSGSSGSSGSSSGSSSDAMGGGSTTSTTTTSSTSQFVIIGTDSWSVDVTVDETDVALIAVGDQVELTGDSLDETLYGTVSEIGLVSSSTGGVAAYPVTIELTGSPEGLHDGTSVTAEIIYERRTNVLAVPSAAVTTEDGQSVVTQEGADGEQVSTVVTVGETSGTMVEITDGLAEGDEVLVTTFTPGAGSGSGSGDDTQQGQMPEMGSGEMPDFSSGEMPGGGQMGGGQMGGSNG